MARTWFLRRIPWHVVPFKLHNLAMACYGNAVARLAALNCYGNAMLHDLWYCHSIPW